MDGVVDGARCGSGFLDGQDGVREPFVSQVDNHIVLAITDVSVTVLAIAEECADVFSR